MKFRVFKHNMSCVLEINSSDRFKRAGGILLFDHQIGQGVFCYTFFTQPSCKINSSSLSIVKNKSFIQKNPHENNKATLREKCPNAQFFQVCIFPYLNYCGVSPRIQSEQGKIQARKNSVFGHFSHRGKGSPLIPHHFYNWAQQLSRS